MSHPPQPQQSQSFNTDAVTCKPLPKLPVGFSDLARFSEHPSDRARYGSRRAELKSLARSLPKEIRNANGEKEKFKLQEYARQVGDELNDLSERERSELIPWHGDEQYLSVAPVLCSPLFSIAHKGARSDKVSVSLGEHAGVSYHYEGPELRQDDGLVFLALVHVARDFRVGTPVMFGAQDLCQALGLSYGGPSRAALKASINRLQKGILCGPTFRVQLIGRFDFPSSGAWSVGLDPSVLHLFDGNRQIWMERQVRATLPGGLASWLYGYIRAQTFLSPTSLELLRKLCGSTAKPENFRDSLRAALEKLAEAGVIDTRFYICRKTGRLHWLRLKRHAELVTDGEPSH